MAVPKRRTSKSRKRLRRGHIGFKPLHLVICDHCGGYKQNHHICPHCGAYHGRIYNEPRLRPLGNQ